MTPELREPAVPVHLFDATVQLDDPIPFAGWSPSPSQIAQWSLQIRSENGHRRNVEPADGTILDELEWPGDD